jgi:hypothetical protein
MFEALPGERAQLAQYAVGGEPDGIGRAWQLTIRRSGGPQKPHSSKHRSGGARGPRTGGIGAGDGRLSAVRVKAKEG